MGSALIIDLAAHRRLQRVAAVGPSGAALRSGTERLDAARVWSSVMRQSLHNPLDFMAATQMGEDITHNDELTRALHKLVAGDEQAAGIATDLVTNLSLVTGFEDVDAVPYLQLLQVSVTASRLWYLHDWVCKGDLVSLIGWLEGVFWGLVQPEELELASRIGSSRTGEILAELRIINPRFGMVDTKQLVRQGDLARSRR